MGISPPGKCFLSPHLPGEALLLLQDAAEAPPLPEASPPPSRGPVISFYLPSALTGGIILFISVLTHVLPVPVLERQLPEDKGVCHTHCWVPSAQLSAQHTVGVQGVFAK